MNRFRALLNDLVCSGAFELPLIGAGRTGERLHWLASIAAGDLQLARRIEAHLDAVTILRESGRSPEDGCLYAVWASEAPQTTLRMSQSGDNVVIRGQKGFCSGLGVVDRALVTVQADESSMLAEISIPHPQLAGAAVGAHGHGRSDR